MIALRFEILRDLFVGPRADPRRPERLRRLRLVERMDRLVIDGGGAVSPIGAEHGDAIPSEGAS